MATARFHPLARNWEVVPSFFFFSFFILFQIQPIQHRIPKARETWGKRTSLFKTVLDRKTRCSMRPWSLSQVSTGEGKILGLEGANVGSQRGLIALSDEQIICVFFLH